METRRDFLKQATALAAGSLPAAILKAMAIEPAPGTTFLDAEHIVVLMQENRSFDHCFGTLQGVRGFNDPRAVTLPGGNPVWLQSNQAGETFIPFRLDLKGSNATWLGCLPHDWADQSLARNGGKHDRWLDQKQTGRAGLGHLPLTLGFHNREDLPFYYALAGAFTVCDQAFCSSLTGTTPNRLHLWSGTIRQSPDPSSRAHVRNHDAETAEGIDWPTLPERLEDHGISWKVYQNELSIATGLGREEAPWLGNFTDNPLEFFARYRVRLARRHREYLARSLQAAQSEWETLATRPGPWTDARKQQTEQAARTRDHFRGEVAKWTAGAFAALPETDRNLHRNAFTTNEGDPHFREVTAVTYDDNGTSRTMNIPRGDVLHQFRQDADAGILPAVSWLVAPQLFSDHPDSPWYGAWYLSEILNILTARPEQWRKTIFILCYDENDGYFDHIPPFVPPDPANPESGTCSAGLEAELEFVRAPQEEAHRAAFPRIPVHTGPIGLGYRVPLVVASPWSRGGYVNSEVFDHTSILRFIEDFASRRSGRTVPPAAITPWRRAVCGDLTSVFRPAPPRTPETGLTRMAREAFLESIHRAQFKPLPVPPRPLTAEEIAAARKDPGGLPALPQQEPGTRPACALPYELAVHGRSGAADFTIEFTAGRNRFGSRAAGAPFHVYAPVPTRTAGGTETGRTWAIAVKPGDSVRHTWPRDLFPGGVCHLRVHGPNGFYREFIDTPAAAGLVVRLEDGALTLQSASGPAVLEVADVSYGHGSRKLSLAPGTAQTVPVAADKSHGWYDLTVKSPAVPGWEQRLAGHLETGRESRTDPLMGRETA